MDSADAEPIRDESEGSDDRQGAGHTGARIIGFPSVGRRDRPDVSTPSTPRQAIGEVLRAERLGQERTLADVADAAHVSLPYLSEVERGRKDVSSDLLVSICEALELPVPDLFRRSAERLDARAQRGARFELLAA